MSWRIRLSAGLLGCAAVWCAEFGLGHILWDGVLVSRLLSPGSHTPWAQLVVSTGFLAVRVLLWVVMPAALISALTTLIASSVARAAVVAPPDRRTYDPNESEIHNR